MLMFGWYTPVINTPPSMGIFRTQPPNAAPHKEIRTVGPLFEASVFDYD